MLIGHRPQSADDAEMIDSLQWWSPAHRLIQPRLDRALRIGIQAENRAQIHAGRMKELQPIRLRPRHRFLMGVDATLAERFKANAREEALADMLLAFDFVFLVVDVE